jgi:hypothetical protein
VAALYRASHWEKNMYLSSCLNCKGSIQVLASSLKNYKIINATLEFNVKTSLKITYLKYLHDLHKIFYMLDVLFKDPNFPIATLLFVYILSCFDPVVMTVENTHLSYDNYQTLHMAYKLIPIIWNHNV